MAWTLDAEALRRATATLVVGDQTYTILRRPLARPREETRES